MGLEENWKLKKFIILYIFHVNFESILNPKIIL